MIYRKLEVFSKLELKTRLDGHSAVSSSQIDYAAVISELALRLEEAISREKALSAVLRIISGSDGDIDTVMDAIMGYALELCDAEFGVLFENHQNGRYCARFSKGIPQKFQDWFNEKGVFSPGAQTGLGRMDAHREVVNIVDIQAEDLYLTDDPLRYATAAFGGARSFVAIPMLAGDELVGAFTIYRQLVRPFTKDATRLA